MSDINEVRERLTEMANDYLPPATGWNRARDDLRALLADHARLLALIDGQKAAPRGPDQPDLCDLCRVREEVRSDAEGIPFCQECWDGWQASEQPSKGEGE